jgi:hypothetical protein
MALGNLPLVLAGGTEASGLKCVPDVAAFAGPAGLLDRDPAAFWAADDGSFRCAHWGALHRRGAALLHRGFVRGGQAGEGGGELDLGEETDVVVGYVIEEGGSVRAEALASAVKGCTETTGGRPKCF